MALVRILKGPVNGSAVGLALAVSFDHQPVAGRTATVRSVNSAEPAAARRVLLSYGSEDHALAQRISDALAQSGVRATNQVWEALPRDGIIARLRQNIRASDVVVLLSRAAWRTSGLAPRPRSRCRASSTSAAPSSSRCLLRRQICRQCCGT